MTRSFACLQKLSVLYARKFREVPSGSQGLVRVPTSLSSPPPPPPGSPLSMIGWCCMQVTLMPAFSASSGSRRKLNDSLYCGLSSFFTTDVFFRFSSWGGEILHSSFAQKFYTVVLLRNSTQLFCSEFLHSRLDQKFYIHVVVLLRNST